MDRTIAALYGRQHPDHRNAPETVMSLETAIAWIEPVRSAVRQYVRARCRCADLADDIAQETCLRLIEYGRREVVRHPYALAFKIAHNQLVSDRRRLGRLDREKDLSVLEAPDPLSDAVVEGRDLLRQLTIALAGMPPLRREVFVRRRLHRQSHEEIAAALNISFASIEKHITRAMMDLRTIATQVRG